jgi:aryl-alcohol dehydrogenase-like predicted oxidoreductase
LKKKRLGRSGLEISVLGLGTWAMGGPDWPYGYGPSSDEESMATIHRAVALGINWIDTAPVYGLGHSEELVGRALAALPASDRPLVFTKCGLVWKNKSIRQRLGAKSIRREAEASLQRLGLEAIDLYQIHWPNGSTIHEAFRTLVELRKEGKVRHIGVSNFVVSELERLKPIAPVESLQPPYSLVRRDVEKAVLPYCLANGIGVIVYSPLESGLLGGKMTRERIQALPDSDWRKRKGEEFREPKLSRNLALAERVVRIAKAKGVSPAALAVAWTLRHPAVTGAIVGPRRPGQLDELAAAPEIELSDEEVGTVLNTERGESAGPGGPHPPRAEPSAQGRGGGAPRQSSKTAGSEPSEERGEH